MSNLELNQLAATFLGSVFVAFLDSAFADHVDQLFFVAFHQLHLFRPFSHESFSQVLLLELVVPQVRGLNGARCQNKVI